MCEAEQEVLLFGPGLLALFEYVHIRACFATKEDMFKVRDCHCIKVFDMPPMTVTFPWCATTDSAQG